MKQCVSCPRKARLGRTEDVGAQDDPVTNFDGDVPLDRHVTGNVDSEKFAGGVFAHSSIHGFENNLLRCEVTRPIEVSEQPWSGWLPTELLAGAIAGGRIVRCDEAREETELLCRFLVRYGADRDV